MKGITPLANETHPGPAGDFKAIVGRCNECGDVVVLLKDHDKTGYSMNRYADLHELHDELSATVRFMLGVLTDVTVLIRAEELDSDEVAEA